MKTIIQSRKTRGFTYRHQCKLSSCSFLMCFSLPEPNSFPGPRQLHINWPRRQCQGYSVQVLWRCHRLLNVDLEVHSYSFCHVLSISLSLFHLSPLPLRSSRDCLRSSSPSQPCTLHFPAARSPHSPNLALTYFPPRHLHSLDVSSSLCVLFCVSSMCLSFTLFLSFNRILSGGFTAGGSSLRPVPSRSEASLRRTQQEKPP